MLKNYLIIDSSNNYVNVIVAENLAKASEGYPNNYFIVEDSDSRFEEYIRDLIDNNYYKTPPA